MKPCTTKSRAPRPFSPANIAVLLAVVLLALLLKAFYSRATADELSWIIKPTARVISWISPLEFEREFHVGFVDRCHSIAIVPSCAGLNFLIAAFCMLACSGIFQIVSPVRKMLHVGFSLVAAYLLTIAANALRILMAHHLYSNRVSWGFLTEGRMHRLAGILVYFFSLWLAHGLARGKAGKKPLPLVPLAWYLSMALLVPLAMRFLRRDFGGFFEHEFFIIAFMVLVLPGFLGGRRLLRKRHGCRPPAGALR